MTWKSGATDKVPSARPRNAERRLNLCSCLKGLVPKSQALDGFLDLSGKDLALLWLHLEVMADL